MLSIVASEPDEQAALKLDLDGLVREGARCMLLAALKAEVDQYVAEHADHRDAAGHALVVRNGVAEPRRVTTAAGALEIQAPRVHDRREGRRFTSAILPPWARRSPKVTEVLPVLYLRGISTKDFEPALAEFFGALQPAAEGQGGLHNIMNAEDKEAAELAIDEFEATYGAKYTKAVDKVLKDREVLLTHFEFPAEHWIHLRTTNVIQSTFATVKLRTRKTKGAGSRSAGLAMAYKLLDAAQIRWRCVNAPHLVALVRAEAPFLDGELIEREDQQYAVITTSQSTPIECAETKPYPFRGWNSLPGKA
jgi:transposase-like protein